MTEAKVLEPSAAEAMRTRVLDAATDLLSVLPLSKVTMEDVARAAGVARQTLYKHFGGKDDLTVALFVREMTLTHHPALAKIAAKPPRADNLTEMFMVELDLAWDYVLLSRTFDPSIAPRIAELVLSAEPITECMGAAWRPALERYQALGIVRPDLDLSRAIRWTIYQHIWLLSHPTALTDDRKELRSYVDEFVIRPLLAASALT